MEDMRKLFFFIAVALVVIIVLMEIGSLGVLGSSADTDIEQLISDDPDLSEAYDDVDLGELSQDKPPGRAIPYLALIDGIVLFTVALIALSLLVPERIHGRVQGVATLIFSIAIVVSGIVMILAAVAAVILMVSLLLAVPFGTLAYLAVYGFFNRGGASGALGLLMTLKLGFAICLALAHQRFLQNKGLVLLIVTSFLGNVVVSLLHGIVPRFLVSITDGIAAIVVAVLAVIWALVLLIGSVLALIKALRLDRV